MQSQFQCLNPIPSFASMFPVASPSPMSRGISDNMEDERGGTNSDSFTMMLPSMNKLRSIDGSIARGVSFSSILKPSSSSLMPQMNSAFRSPSVRAAHASTLRSGISDTPFTNAVIIDLSSSESTAVRSPSTFDSDFASSMSYRSPEFQSASEFSSPLSLASNGCDKLVLDDEVDLIFSAKTVVQPSLLTSVPLQTNLPNVAPATTLQMLALQHQSSEQQASRVAPPPPPTTIRSKSEDLTHSTALLSIDVSSPRMAGSLHRFKPTALLTDDDCFNTTVLSTQSTTLQSVSVNPFTQSSIPQPAKPPSPVPVGSQWLHLSRQPLLNERCMSHFHVLDEAKELIITRISLLATILGPEKAHPSHVADLIALIEKQFNEARLQTTQNFLQRAKTQSAVEADPKYVAQQAMVAKSKQLAIRQVQTKNVAAAQLTATATTAPMILDEEADAEVARVAKDNHVPSKPSVRVKTVFKEIEQRQPVPVISTSSFPSASTSAITAPLSEPRARRNGIESCPTLKTTCSLLHSLLRSSENKFVPLSTSTPAIPEEKQEEKENNEVQPLATHNKSEKGITTPPPHGELHSPPALAVPPRARSVEFQSHTQMHSTVRRKLEFSMNKPLSNTPTRTSTRIPTIAASASSEGSLSSSSLASSAPAPQPPRTGTSTEPMRVWFEHNLDDPYPSAELKLEFCEHTGLTYDQVQHWFINVRMRLWKPLLKKRNQERAKMLRAQKQQDSVCSTSKENLNTSTVSIASVAVPSISTSIATRRKKKKSQPSSKKKKPSQKHARPAPLEADEEEEEPSKKRVKIEPSVADVSPSDATVITVAKDDDAMLCEENIQDIEPSVSVPAVQPTVEPILNNAPNASVWGIAMQESMKTEVSLDVASARDLNPFSFRVRTITPSARPPATTSSLFIPSTNTINFEQSKLLC